jgi:hypothetical protein
LLVDAGFGTPLKVITQLTAFKLLSAEQFHVFFYNLDLIFTTQFSNSPTTPPDIASWSPQLEETVRFLIQNFILYI